MRSGFILLFLTFSLCLEAQDRCGTKVPTDGGFEIWLEQKISEQKAQRTAQPLATVYQIPVVVHVFHKGEPIGTGVNLSYERIKGQIDSLTADFRRMNADRVNTPAEFEPLAADIEIEFVLAKQDPQGNPTDGIVRLRGTRDTYRALSHRPLLRSESYWPAEHYLNIVVTDLQTFIGYAAFPRTNIEGISNDDDDFIHDGVIVDYQYFGVNFDTPSFDSFGRTLTHEVGHWLGLRHIWGDGGCGFDDFVEDTPLANSDNRDYGSPCTFPNPDDLNVCVEGEPEMFQNYMDYTDDECMNLFTEGQKTRMRIVAENAPDRFSLTTSPGLVEPTRFVDDLALVKILEPTNYICGSQIFPTIAITNHGTNEITSHEIQLYINGSPIGSPLSTSNSLDTFEIQTIIFPDQAITTLPTTISFEVTEVNSTTDGNNTNNHLSIILMDTTTATFPFTENFEGIISTGGKFGPEFPWEVVNAPDTESGNQALSFKAFNNTTAAQEYHLFTTPVLDLTGFEAVDLSFNYSYSDDPDALDDGLLIRYSNDCGETYESAPLFFEYGERLATTNPSLSTSAFIPSNQTDWLEARIFIPKNGDDYSDQVQIAFFGLNGSGNNLYIDDIRIDLSDRREFDASIINIDAPRVTCNENSTIEVDIRNVGFEDINSVQIGYLINQESRILDFGGLNIEADDFETLRFQVDNPERENDIEVEILQVNQQPDNSPSNNEIQAKIIFDPDTRDEYPLLVDFETEYEWIISESISLWNDTTVNGNGSLRGDGFSNLKRGEENWFVSPILSTGNLDSAGLSFRVSYAKRNIIDDNLKVMVSLDCGRNYNTIVDADADSLAITSSEDQWVPEGASDWKEWEFNLDNTILFRNNIRIAFVFTSSGGNDLYIDDIQIIGNELPTYENVFRVYPNPATSEFNLGLNLPEKEPITIRLIDMSGRVVFEERIPNAFNQILEYQTPNQEGLYFVQIQGARFKTTQKLFINR